MKPENSKHPIEPTGRGYADSITELDPKYGLPIAPSRNYPVSAAMFETLLAAAKRSGWHGVWVAFAEGRMVKETPPGDGRTRTRPARRAVLYHWFKRRPDLHAMLSEACDDRTSRLVNKLENTVESIALGEGDRTEDYGKDGNLTRVRVDRRNKLHAALKLLNAHAPETYSERRKLEVSGSVDHNHTQSVGSGFVLQADDIARLEPDEQRQLFALLGRVHELQQADPDRPKRELIDEPAKQSLSQGDAV